MYEEAIEQRGGDPELETRLAAVKRQTASPEKAVPAADSLTDAFLLAQQVAGSPKALQESEQRIAGRSALPGNAARGKQSHSETFTQSSFTSSVAGEPVGHSEWQAPNTVRPEPMSEIFPGSSAIATSEGGSSSPFIPAARQFIETPVENFALASASTLSAQPAADSGAHQISFEQFLATGPQPMPSAKAQPASVTQSSLHTILHTEHVGSENDPMTAYDPWDSFLGEQESGQTERTEATAAPQPKQVTRTFPAMSEPQSS
ncbi:MAG: hypothetical protein KDA85_13320, partial [Planctomycetaceae bacterium]|nr:hypothetical protein [Planctomycetaceae bacterium]